MIKASDLLRFARLILLLYITGLYSLLLIFFLKLKKSLVAGENVTINRSTLMCIVIVSGVTFLYGLNIIAATILPVLDKYFDGMNAYESSLYFT